MISLTNYDFQWARSELVIKFTQVTWDGNVAFQRKSSPGPQNQRIKRPGAGWNGTRVQVLWRF